MTFYKPAPARRYPGKQRDFICDEVDCGMFPDAPMLHEDVWNSVSHPRGLLCIKHTAERLGRPILIDDLSDCPGNAFTLFLADQKPSIIIIDSLSTMMQELSDQQLKDKP